MGRLQTMPARVSALPPRLTSQARDRQASRALATNSTAWLRLRQQVLDRDTYRCQAPTCGRLVAGKGQAHVDHVDGNSSNNDLSNLATLCVRCHSAKTASENGGFGNSRTR